MKKILFLSIFIAMFFSCSENAPIIPCLSCGNEATVLEAVPKNVLIEEFTGVRCVNCPAGSAEIEGLLDIHQDRLVAVSIHAGFFSNPYADSKADYTIEAGTFLNDFLDAPQGYPTAVINRNLFLNEDDLQVGRGSWGGYIAEEKALDTPMNLSFTTNFDESTRVLTVESRFGSAATLENNEIRYSIMLTESGIIDYQLTPDGKQEDYEHKHVLRAMLTGFSGDPIAEEMELNTWYDKVNTYTLPDDWKTEKMSVIVFAHYGGAQRGVLQVEEKEL